MLLLKIIIFSYNKVQNVIPVNNLHYFSFFSFKASLNYHPLPYHISAIKAFSYLSSRKVTLCHMKQTFSNGSIKQLIFMKLIHISTLLNLKLGISNHAPEEILRQDLIHHDKGVNYPMQQDTVHKRLCPDMCELRRLGCNSTHPLSFMSLTYKQRWI